MRILEAQEDPTSDGDILVRVEGRKQTVRIVGGARCGNPFEFLMLVAKTIMDEKAKQILPDDRHDRGYPKVAQTVEPRIIWAPRTSVRLMPLTTMEYVKVRL